MLGKITVPKYGDPRSPLIIVIIDNNCISNVLVDLGASIDVITYEIMIKIKCTKAKPTSIVMQLVDRSNIMPYGIVEDVVIVLDSWEYLVDFMIVKIKSNIPRYLIILDKL